MEQEYSDIQVKKLSELANNAMTQAYIAARSFLTQDPQKIPLTRYQEVCQRGLHENYEGSVYEDEFPHPDHFEPPRPRPHIDPHDWHGMQQGVIGSIENAVDRITDIEPDKYLENYINKLREGIATEDQYMAFKLSIMVAGIEAARTAIIDKQNGITPLGR